MTTSELGKQFDRSLEVVIAEMGDPTEAVYATLFERQPQLLELFVLDVDGAVRGEMLVRALETLSALAHDEGYAETLLASEYINHRGIGVPEAGFDDFMNVLIDTFARELGARWSAEFDRVWRKLATRVEQISAHAERELA